MTKDEILAAIEEGRSKLNLAIEGLSDAQLQEPGVTGEWSVKDLLFHITTWESELVKLLWQAAEGQQATSLLVTDQDIDGSNARVYALGKDRPLESVRQDFHGVHTQIVRRAGVFSDADLSDLHRFPWLGGDPLWQWIAGDSFEHEAEHGAEILEWRRKKGY
jgi:hypothetical protein